MTPYPVTAAYRDRLEARSEAVSQIWLFNDDPYLRRIIRNVDRAYEIMEERLFEMAVAKYQACFKRQLWQQFPRDGAYRFADYARQVPSLDQYVYSQWQSWLEERQAS